MKRLHDRAAAARSLTPVPRSTVVALAGGMALMLASPSALASNKPIPGVDIIVQKKPGGNAIHLPIDKEGRISGQVGPGDYTVTTACREACPPHRILGTLQKNAGSGSSDSPTVGLRLGLLLPVWDDTDIVHVVQDATSGRRASGIRFDDTDIVHVVRQEIQAGTLFAGDHTGFTFSIKQGSVSLSGQLPRVSDFSAAVLGTGPRAARPNSSSGISEPREAAMATPERPKQNPHPSEAVNGVVALGPADDPGGFQVGSPVARDGSFAFVELPTGTYNLFIGGRIFKTVAVSGGSIDGQLLRHLAGDWAVGLRGVSSAESARGASIFDRWGNLVDPRTSAEYIATAEIKELGWTPVVPRPRDGAYLHPSPDESSNKPNLEADAKRASRPEVSRPSAGEPFPGLLAPGGGMVPRVPAMGGPAMSPAGPGGVMGGPRPDVRPPPMGGPGGVMGPVPKIGR